MSDENYTKWNELQDAASRAKDVVDQGRGADDPRGWTLLVNRALALQDLATAFAKEVI